MPTQKPFLFPGLPLIHQPHFEESWPFAEHSIEINELARSLNRDGFAVIDFPETEFDGICDRLKQTLNPHYAWDKWHNGEQEDLRIQDAWSFCSETKKIAVNKNIIEILGALYGRKAFPFQTLNFAVGTQQLAHSDHVHFNSIPGKFMCGVWVALEDANEENGALIYYPGSHNWLDLNNEHFAINVENQSGDDIYAHYSRYTDAWQMLAAHHQVKPKTAVLKKGQAVIWTSHVVHGGGTILDRSRSRWSQVTHYFFDNCVYTTPLANTQALGKLLYRDVVDIANSNNVGSKITSSELTHDEIKSASAKFCITQDSDTCLQMHAASVYTHHKLLPDDFDALSYLKKNHDVLNAMIDPYQHYIDYGKKEGRRW